MEQSSAKTSSKIKYLDLHNHPFFKPVFSENLSPWDEVPDNGYLVGEIIRSQANLRQINGGNNSNLICVALYAPELALINQWILKLAPLFTKAIDPAVLNRMKDSTFDYHEEILVQKQSFRRSAADSVGLKGIVEIKTFEDYKQDDTDNIYVFYSIEGGHAFYGKCNTNLDINEILDNLQNFVSQSEYLVTYITPCHLTPNNFMTHAFGIKIFAKGEFIPVGCGITDEGRLFLEKIAELNVLIDVKHMSLVSRQQFYQNKSIQQKPFICSHAGVTGVSWDQKLVQRQETKGVKKGPGFVKVRYRKPSGLLQKTFFNPCSINLYNEDIIEILSSGGLIGISMDIRIIGGSRNLLGFLKKHEIEFVSSKEFTDWEQQHKLIDKLIDSDYDEEYKLVEPQSTGPTEVIWDLEDKLEELEELHGLSKNDFENFFSELDEETAKVMDSFHFRDRSAEHFRYFVNQLFHIIRVAENAGMQDPWKQICLGSDFDGFINAIDSCKNASELQIFADLLINNLSALAGEANIRLPRSPEDLVRDIFYYNAYRLFRNNFS